jgi:hypothetical protein
MTHAPPNRFRLRSRILSFDRALIGRRRLLLGAGAAAAMLPLARLEAASPRDVLRHAIFRAGGREALARVRILSWEGEAIVHAGGRDVRIGVSTMVVPFVAARSASWPLDQGKAATRTMTIRSDVGRVERGGTSEPLPPATVAHERAQFAMYGLMLLATLDKGQAGVRILHDERGMNVLRVDHPGAPVTRLYFEGDGRLAEATNEVPDPEGGAPIPQHFFFSAETMPGPVRWPRKLRIEQRGRPYFELTLSRFEAGL